MSSRARFIFDADGVLLDSLSLACKHFNKIADEQFPVLPKVACQEDMAHVYPGPLKSSLKRFGLTKEHVKSFFDLHTAAMLAGASEVAPFDEVLAGIRTHAFGRCAIVSSAFSETVQAALNRSCEYAPGMFTHIRGREPGKDKADKIKEVLHDWQCDTNDAIYIGDMVSDILYCRAVPIRVAAVGYGYHPSSYLSAFDPDYLLPDAQSLVAFLGERAQPRV